MNPPDLARRLHGLMLVGLMVIPTTAPLHAGLIGIGGQPMALPDPLVTAGGVAITSPEAWLNLRRPELLELFRSQMHGRNPVERPDSLAFETETEPQLAAGGTAERSRHWVTYAGPGGTGQFLVTLFTPVGSQPAKGVFIFLNINPNAVITGAGEEELESPRWPVRDLIRRGYATAAFQHSDVAGALGTDFAAWVHGRFDPPGPRAPDAWGVVAAWAWGISRTIDCLETLPKLRGLPIAVVGHSRGGKATLWAGATDERISLAISNNSGAGGASLARAEGGETFHDLNSRFPGWFCENFHRYNTREEDLPFDMHQLLALSAPRRVYVASATEDLWANPPAEFQACVEAAPVFALFGLAGVGDPTFPAPGEARHAGAIGYHLRIGKHLIDSWDWARFMDYTDRHWAGPAERTPQ